ncbi:tetratricopeptide repeat protein [Streptomyces sp. NPDC058665]|uniref:tetratricopeptide repeat protein n=1 Tax=Streptomyces sp. NPDC058665 TaxID=3346586 RepID=UPI003664E338
MSDESIDQHSASSPEPVDSPEGFGYTGGGSWQVMRRLVAHYLRTADRADRLAYPFRSRIDLDADHLPRMSQPEMGDAQAAEQWLVIESANLLSALDWTRQHGSERQLALAAHVLAGFLDMEGYLGTAEPILRRAVAYWRAAGDDAARARALLDLSGVCSHSGDYDGGHAAASEALGLARSLSDSELESESIHHLWIPLWHTGQFVLAQTLQERALYLRKQSGDTLQIARSHNLLGITQLHLGRDHEALDLFEQALLGFAEASDNRGRYRLVQEGHRGG